MVGSSHRGYSCSLNNFREPSKPKFQTNKSIRRPFHGLSWRGTKNRKSENLFFNFEGRYTLCAGSGEFSVVGKNNVDRESCEMIIDDVLGCGCDNNECETKLVDL